MNYVINPMFFYWIEVVGSLKGLLIGISTFGIVVFGMFGFVSFLDTENYLPFITPRRLTVGVVICVIMLVISIFVPSKKNACSNRNGKTYHL